MDRGRRWLNGFLVFVAAVLVLMWTAEVYTDFLWYRHDAYLVVFWRKILAQVLIVALVAPALWWFLRANLRRAAEAVPLSAPDDDEQAEAQATLDSAAASSARWLPVLAALFGGLWATRGWQSWLMVLWGVPFDQADPAFGLDAGFYVYRLNAFQQLLGTLNTLLLATAAVATLIYLLRKVIVMGQGELTFDRGARGHLLALAAGLLVVRAGLLWLRRYQLVTLSDGLHPGAGWTDVHVRLPVLALCALLALAAAAVCWRVRAPGRAARPAYWAIGALVVVQAVGGGLVPSIAQRVIVRPNELDRELPYLERAIAGTRQAFRLDDVRTEDAQASGRPAAAQLAAHRDTLDNVRVWDHRPLLRTFKQLQEIRQYYDIIDVDSDRYVLDGRMRQVLLAAREMNAAQLDVKARSWLNQHLEYTHGYGLVACLAYGAAADGQPEFILRDLPPTGAPELRIDEPRIYFGEVILMPGAEEDGPRALPGTPTQAGPSADEIAERWRRRLNDTAEPAPTDYVLVGGSRDEFDFPETVGDREVQRRYRYTGEAGVPIPSFWRRLLFGLRFHSIELVMTSFTGPDSKLLMYRQITRRVKKAAPYLVWDTSPYPVVIDGRIKWICEGYTMSRSYPYAEMHLERVITPRGWRVTPTWNYLRNPVKAVVDAYDGTIDLWVVDEQDPLCRTFDRLYPGMLKPATQAPAELRAHFRYPQLLFRSQADLYQRYHMTDPRQFYAAEDLWATARRWDRASAEQRAKPGRAGVQQPDAYAPMDPYYIMMSLPGEGDEQFMLLNAYTPFSARDRSPRDNLIAYLVGLCDGDRYGELRAYRLPKDHTTYGPLQVEALIDQDETISALLTLWDKGGSRVVRGHLLVVPVAETLLYVQPLYLEAEQKGLPELKRVVVVHDQRVVLGETFADALQQLFGPEVMAAPPTPVVTPPTPADTPPLIPAPTAGTRAEVEAAQAAFAEWDEQVRAGDWQAAEAAREKLRQALAALEALGQTLP